MLVTLSLVHIGYKPLTIRHNCTQYRHDWDMCPKFTP